MCSRRLFMRRLESYKHCTLSPMTMIGSRRRVVYVQILTSESRTLTVATGAGRIRGVTWQTRSMGIIQESRGPGERPAFMNRATTESDHGKDMQSESERPGARRVTVDSYGSTGSLIQSAPGGARGVPTPQSEALHEALRRVTRTHASI